MNCQRKLNHWLTTSKMDLKGIIKKVLREQDWTDRPSSNPNISVNPPKQKTQTQTTQIQNKPVIGWTKAPQDLVDAFGIDVVKQQYESKGFSTKIEGGQLFVIGLLPKSYLGAPTFKFGRGPESHQEVGTGTSWASLNAWDYHSEPGAVVYSLTKGKVLNKVNPNSDNCFLHGDQLTIKGTDGYPSVYYTHIESPLSIGDVVTVGQEIGKVLYWKGDKTGCKSEGGSWIEYSSKDGGEEAYKKAMTHVHIGLSDGWNINSLLG